MFLNVYFQEAVGLFQNVTGQYVVQLDTNTRKERRESVFQIVVAFEKFTLNYGDNHLSKTAPQINITNSKLCK